VPGEGLAAVLGAVLATGAVNGVPDAPEPELLEYLGGFQAADGRWFDPLILKPEPEQGRAEPSERRQKE